MPITISWYVARPATGGGGEGSGAQDHRMHELSDGFDAAYPQNRAPRSAEISDRTEPLPDPTFSASPEASSFAFVRAGSSRSVGTCLRACGYLHLNLYHGMGTGFT
ncbi:aquaporin PIP1-like protein [Anopheles sinensis]|uniref:Aquaporin PIP1-like protein n=1 Tax=Anopheles sinensis TaxID=74873 RepID=A0A084VYG5_ANOSI|nr:aquaporin PIP1-like protein [Anopheles sinensis]